MPEKLTLHYAGQAGEGYGWGVANTNLRRQLAQHFTLTEGEADIVFMPLADHEFNSATPARGRLNLAYTFFEFPLGPNAAANAAKYDVVFCGSTWCLNRMRERGITNGRVLIQGVDHEVFKPAPLPKSGFNIFSGGKFEFRKGQDLVIAAFREFIKTDSRAHLVCAWNNPWPQLIHSMKDSPFIKWAGSGSTQHEFFASLLVANGIPRERFTILPPMNQHALAASMAGTHVGLFPNRCEGGTNLVMMEYAALGREIIANELTGHADVADAITLRIEAKEDERHWAVQKPEYIVGALKAAGSLVEPKPVRYSWADSAQTIVSACKELVSRQSVSA